MGALTSDSPSLSHFLSLYYKPPPSRLQSDLKYYFFEEAIDQSG